MQRSRDISPLPERNHALVLAALGYLIGCRMAGYVEAGAWLLLSAALCVPMYWLLRRVGRLRALALFLCALSMGAYAAGRALKPEAPVPGMYEITGYVYGKVTPRSDDRVSFTLGDITLDGAPQSGYAYCTAYLGGEPPALYDGAALRFTGRVYQPDGKSGAPHFDFRLWLYQNGMHCGVAISKELEVLNTPATAPVRDAAYRARTACGDALTRTMGESARLAMAMLFSDREGLSEEESEAFRTLGVAHVLSVSGLHVGLLGGLLVWLLSRLRVRRLWQTPVVMVFLLGYCALSGFSASSQRAAIMLTLVLLARVLGRRPDPLATLAAAMLVVLVIDPLQAYSASFALSFSAVAGIALCYPVLLSAFARKQSKRALHARRSLARRVASKIGSALGRPRELIALSLAAQLGVLLPTAAIYNRLPLYGVFINLIVVPYTVILTPLFAMTLLLSPIPFIGAGMGAVAGFLGDGLLWLVRLMSALPYATVRVPTAPTVALCCAALVMLIVSRRTRGSLARRALAAVLCVAIGAGGAYASRPPAFRYIQLAVGQADAALLLDGDKTVAIDVGADGTAVTDYLLSENRELDALILTHLHYDHAGGVVHLLNEGIRIRRAYLPVNAREQRVDAKTMEIVALLEGAGVPITELAYGDELRYNEAVIRVLWPVRENVRRGQDANELPLALAVDFGGYTLLNLSDLTGDYERYVAERCDVLKVAHHGSGDGTLDALLDTTAPRLALISCSSGSKTLPSAETLQRLADRAIPYARTDVCGDITITLRDGRLVATPYKARIIE